MGSSVKKRMLAAAVAGVLGAGLVPLTPAAPAAAHSCASQTICFHREKDYAGYEWHWWPTLGYRNVPSALHDHAYSFTAVACAWAIDHRSDGTTEYRAIHVGDYRRDWDFGRKIDAVTKRACP